MHPFTGIEITDKGIAWLSDWVGAIREVIGMEVPLSSDHYGHIGVNSCIRWRGRWRSTTSRGWRTWCRGSSAS